MRGPERDSRICNNHVRPIERVNLIEARDDQAPIDFGTLDPLQDLDSVHSNEQFEGSDLSESSQEKLPKLLPQFPILEKQRRDFLRGYERLTEQEHNVLALYAHGKKRPEIAYQLKMSEFTAKAHIASIHNKLGLHTAVEIIHYAHDCGRFGLVEQPMKESVARQDSDNQNRTKFYERAKQLDQMNAPSESDFLQSLPTLTKRERGIVDLTVLGLSNKQIAGKVFIAEKTVKGYLGSIYKKLKVANKAMLQDCIRKFGMSGGQGALNG